MPGHRQAKNRARWSGTPLALIMNMKICDPDKLIPDPDTIHRIVRSHPFGQGLKDEIDTVLVGRSANGPRIQFDSESCTATLYLSEDAHTLTNYEYILYHEFSHVEMGSSLLLTHYGRNMI